MQYIMFIVFIIECQNEQHTGEKNTDLIFVSVKRRKIHAGNVASWMYTAVTSVCVIIYHETAQRPPYKYKSLNAIGKRK